MHIKPNKDVHLCSRKSIPIGNLNNNTPKEIFNSEKMQNVRKRMENGQCVTGCEKCYHEDTVNDGQSLRTFMNNWFHSLIHNDNVLPWKEGYIDRLPVEDEEWVDIFKNLVPNIIIK